MFSFSRSRKNANPLPVGRRVQDSRSEERVVPHATAPARRTIEPRKPIPAAPEFHFNDEPRYVATEVLRQSINAIDWAAARVAGQPAGMAAPATEPSPDAQPSHGDSVQYDAGTHPASAPFGDSAKQPAAGTLGARMAAADRTRAPWPSDLPFERR